jgi:hypothetical protein
LLAAANLCLVAAHQTSTLSPVVVGAGLPYELDVRILDFPADQVPTLHSFAQGQHDGKWIFLAGRTNGLHDITQSGINSFPPVSQNRDVWVIDPVTRQSWRRSLDDPSSGLTPAQIDSLSATNAQFYQQGDRLYMTGGYGISGGSFATFDALTAIDLPGISDWVQSGTGTAAENIRQLRDPVFQVTGGGMELLGGRTRLIFGQNFSGGYASHKSGTYTNQVKSFEIRDDGIGLAIENLTLTEPSPDFRRRDLNVVPIVDRNASGELVEELVAFSGVFTDTNGTWTVPVEIDADGGLHMDDPALSGTFRQAMNNYHSARSGLYSESRDEMHVLLYGGITLQTYDREAGEFITDDRLPFTNQITSIVVDSQGQFKQHLLPEEFPAVFDDTGKPLFFGASAEFLLAEGVPTYENGVIRMDDLEPGQRIGYIVGGIVSDAPNRGNTAASNLIFEVVYRPVPEPGTPLLLVIAATSACGVWWLVRGRRASGSRP